MEIERKYLPSALPPADLLGTGVEIQQGYLDAGDPEIRVRRLGASPKARASKRRATR